MKILLLTTHVNTGGITSYILTLGGALVRSGHQVTVVSSGGDNVDRLERAGMRHIRFNIRTKSEVDPKLWMSLPSLVRLIREEGINIVHAHTRVTQVLGSLASRITGVNMVTTCHGFFKPRWSRKMFPCWGQAVIAISKPVEQHLSADLGVPRDKVHMIGNGIDLDRFTLIDDHMRKVARQKMNIPDIKLIGIIARLSSVKGIDNLIKAMPLILKAFPSAKLLIAGQGNEEANLKKLTQDLSLTDSVDFRDTIGQTQDLLAAFDVFVMPSLMEGLGLSVMEAQACGIPVVASRVGGLVDLIEDGKNGFLAAVNDPEALAQCIIKVLRDPPLASQMALVARSNIERHFSAGKMSQQTFGIYEQYSGR